jgi:DNA polymerase-3 subunit epsilon
LILAPHPTGQAFDAFWLAGGRLVEWGPVPEDPDELLTRTRAAVARGGRAGELGAHIPPDEIDEVRIIASYLASHPDTPQLILEGGDPNPDQLERFVAQAANGSSTTSAATAS